MDNNDFYTQLINANKYDKSGLFNYIEIKDTNLFYNFYNGDWEICIKNPGFTTLTRQGGKLRQNENSMEFTYLTNILKQVKSRKIEQEMKETNLPDEYLKEKINTLRIWLFKLYCLYKPIIKEYQMLQTGKANPGGFQSERKKCLAASLRAERIKVTFRNGLCTNVHSFSTRYYPMPTNLINNTFVDKINNSCIANRFEIDKNENSELIFEKGTVFETLRNIIIELLETHSKFKDFTQGKGKRDSYTPQILKSFTGLYYLIKDYDLYILENKLPTLPEELICKLLFGDSKDKNIPILKDKIKNFRNWEKNHKTTFPITFLPD